MTKKIESSSLEERDTGYFYRLTLQGKAEDYTTRSVAKLYTYQCVYKIWKEVHLPNSDHISPCNA